jgi:hypothetical protein
LIRKTAIELAVAMANVVAFLLALFVGYGFVFPLLHGVLGLGEVGPGVRHPISWYQGFVLSLCVTFAAFGGLARLWTRHVLNVLVTSAGVFLVGMLILAQAQYLADRGDPSIMWDYIRPGASEYLGATCAAASAAIAWWVFGNLRRRSTPTSQQQAAAG